jgi:hypothetical protein
MKRLQWLLTFILLIAPFTWLKAQHEIRIQGVVRDVTTSEPIGGVSIIHNGNQVAFTDIDGKYAAFVPNNASLLFYKPEYNDYVTNVDNRQILNVNMTVKMVELDESIVVGKMSKKTIVVDQTELEIVGNYFHLKTKFRVPKHIFTTDKRFIVQPTLFNVTRETADYFRPVVIDGEVYKINRQRIMGFQEDDDVLKPYIVDNTLPETDHIYAYHDSVFIAREHFNEDFRAECFLAVNSNFENVKRDFLDTVVIARGTQNPLRFLDYKIDPLELTDTSFIPKPEMKLVAEKGVSRIGFVIGKAEIDKKNPQNEVEMNAIKQKLADITSNRFSTLNGIEVIGYASPDGVYRNNAILAQKRTDVVLNEIVSSLPVTIQKYVKLSSMSVVEPWSKVAEFMEGDSLALAKQVREIVVANNDDYVKTQAQLRRLPGYKDLIANTYLPKLRRVEYLINHTVFRNLTVPEIWDRFHRGEQDISRYEYWKMIESCEDSLKKVEMERIALKQYKNFTIIANREAVRLHSVDSINLDVLRPCVDRYAPQAVVFNQSLMALKSGDVQLADSLMRYMPTTPENSYLKAIVNTLNGNYDEAYPFIASMGGLNEVLILLCQGRNKDADAKITVLLEDQTNWKDAKVWYVKAICANRLEDLNWAIDALTQAIALDPKLEEIARLDSDVMDIIEIISPKEEEKVE